MLGGSYSDVKQKVLTVLGVAAKKDIVSGYGSQYKAGTKLASIGVTADNIGFTIADINDWARKTFKDNWHTLDFVTASDAKTIGAFILLVCQYAEVAIPEGEPR